MLPAPAHLPTASMRNQERYLPRLHHQPRPPPPASRLAPPQRTAQNVENSTLNTRRITRARARDRAAREASGLVLAASRRSAQVACELRGRTRCARRRHGLDRSGLAGCSSSRTGDSHPTGSGAGPCSSASSCRHDGAQLVGSGGRTVASRAGREARQHDLCALRVQQDHQLDEGQAVYAVR